MKLSENAILPTKDESLLHGYNLYTTCDVTVPGSGKVQMATDLAFLFPHGIFGRIFPRYYPVWKYSIQIGEGIINEEFKGNLKIMLYNMSKYDVYIPKGRKIARLIIEKIIEPPLVEVNSFDITEKDNVDIGSSGLN